MRACERVPALGNAGVKRVINGPMIWSPDSAALFGPVPELKNYYCCNGIIPGFSQSGGLGSMLAQWIVEGEPMYDMFPWDLARYGIDWTPKSFVMARVMDSYAHRFKIHFPYEEREAGRPVKTRPLYEKQKSLGAVFGLNYGWEHPLWFAGEGKDGHEDYGFERQDWFHSVKAECAALRKDVGIIDVSNFAKYSIRGKGAREWLDKVVANKVPTEIGRSCLTPMLGIRGGIAGDFTITMLGEDDYYMVGSGMAERYHQRFFAMVPMPDTVRFESLTDAKAGFNIAGPKSRELLQRLTNENLFNDNWKFMRSKKLTIGGIDAVALRVSFTGDLGWEVYVNEDKQLELYETLLETGKDLGVRPVGGRSLLSLRVEKGYGSWGREYSPEYWPQEVGLDRLIKLDKPEFLGREAYIALKDQEPREKLMTFEVETPHNADAVGGEPIFDLSGVPVGRVSSGAYGHTVGKSIALGFVKTGKAIPGSKFNIAILGLDHQATLLDAAPFDPEGARLRA